MNYKNNFDSVKSSVREKSSADYSEAFVKDYLDFFNSRWPESISSIIFYGSCLNEATRKDTSTPDFFIVSTKYLAFHKSIIHSILNWFLTPNTYSIDWEKLRGKYNVISQKDLKRETSPRAGDIYNLGRFTKRIALIYAKNEAARAATLNALADAYYSVALKARFLVPRNFSLDEFIDSALKISYVGEKRVEADDKILRLKNSEKDFYEKVYSFILDDMVHSKLISKNSEGYEINKDIFAYKLGKWRSDFFLYKSRIRAKMRWPKSIYTFKGWVDVLLAKLERTKGIKIELSEKERKYPLIFGWKYYFRFKKDKIIK